MPLAVQFTAPKMWRNVRGELWKTESFRQSGNARRPRLMGTSFHLRRQTIPAGLRLNLTLQHTSKSDGGIQLHGRRHLLRIREGRLNLTLRGWGGRSGF